MIKKCGATIIGQTDQLAPADRKTLRAARPNGDSRESGADLRVDIEGKKLAAGLDGLVLDVKTGSGAFLRKVEDAEYLAAPDGGDGRGRRGRRRRLRLLYRHGAAAGPRVGQLDRGFVECVELLRGERPAFSEDLRELSLILAGWMIHLRPESRTWRKMGTA